jgi:selenide,water dikinase
VNSESPIRLTQTVKKGGCAAKIAAAELRRRLSQIKFPPPPAELLIGSQSFDDAAIYKINDDFALVQTLDFFTPIVDSPKLFGRIAAANALSDVYAMGGRPKTAMAILAFPLDVLDEQVAIDVLQGATEVIHASGAALVGGHSIDDDTLKFGLSVTGFVNPKLCWSNAGAKVGNALILTKALGTGTLTAALKRNEATEAEIEDGIQSMCLLNRVIDFLPSNLSQKISAATDITGFGLAGHALNLARASQVTLEIETEKLPRFKRALEFIEKGFLTKAHRTNRDYTSSDSEILNVSPSLQQLLFDPQTSGGLLLSVQNEAAPDVIACLSQKFPETRQIGIVKNKDKNLLRFL